MCSDLSPADAAFVPPPPDRVSALLDDLVEFVDLDVLPAVAQAAIAHAEFETIHPFGDGNGRPTDDWIGAFADATTTAAAAPKRLWAQMDGLLAELIERAGSPRADSVCPQDRARPSCPARSSAPTPPPRDTA